MNLRQLRYFCAVVDSGSLAKAAERLFVAPTAISMQIGQLETDLGGLLFDRRVKPMALTALGRYVLPRARELLADGDRLQRQARDLASGRGVWLGVGFVRSLLNSVLPGAIRLFRSQHPEVRLELVELLSEHQVPQLRSGALHVGLSRFPAPTPPPPDLRHTLLFTDPFVAALPAQHPLAAGRASVPLQALDALPLISYPKDPQSSFAAHTLALLEQAGARPRIGHEAIEIHTALGLVAAGLGYALVGASVAWRGHRDVAFMRVDGLAAQSTVLAVTRADEQDTLVDDLLQAVRAQLATAQQQADHPP